MKLPKYDLVFSVGQYCAAAMYMRKHHLRRMAGPLDWIGKPENCLETHFKLICTDFKGFLRKETLVPHENRRRPEIDDMAHDYYRDGETDIRLFHEFPTGVPVDEAYPAIRKKYDRRIARFYAAVASSKRTLFVYHSRCGRLEDRTIIEGMAAVRKRFAGSQIDLLVIENVPGTDGYSMDEPAPGIYHIRAGLFEHSNNRVLGNIELGDRIYSLIRCRGMLRNRLRQRLLKTMIRLRTILVFGREARHAASARLMVRYGLK